MSLKHSIITLLLIFAINNIHAVEGMWLPILLKKYNIEEMQQKGFKLTAEDIYDINQASLKDAIVGLVRLNSPFHHFCTGEIISPDGLVLTNHHCGYGAIQNHSSVENDYLKDGFWAMNRGEELTNDGLGMCMLKRMEDVTDKVLMNIPDDADAIVHDSILTANIKAIEEKAIEGTEYIAKVKSFYNGNEYYISVYEIFKDIRLVGAPPSAIGKFGGDTDNWMWPRHTGDFSMFRIYVNKDNKPADISQDNIPYQPIQHLNISTSGVKKGDFTMVMGYPGTTEEYLPSFAIDMRMNQTNPIRIKIRNDAINIMKADMNKSQEVRIQYSAKVASKANGWKKWIGENRGLKRLNAIEVKKEQENNFTEWVNLNEARQKEYRTILNDYERIYSELAEYQLAYTYLVETILGAEIVDLAGDFNGLLQLDKASPDSVIKPKVEALQKKINAFYKNYNQTTDKKLFITMLSYYYKGLDAKYQPAIFNAINKKYKGDYQTYFADLFDKSIFNDQTSIEGFLAAYTPSKNKKLMADPAMTIFNECINIYRTETRPFLVALRADLSKVHKSYVKGLREFDQEKVFSPDANSTFRIAYGQIDNYTPRDAVNYHYATTLNGIMEKDNPDIFDYDVPQKLRDLFASKDFGQYANADGTMPVCFTASNHTTGGNSGSPVLNANGELIGINFDRNWEGTMSDLMYDPNMCRNITLDVRYILFIVDKFAGATHLIEELYLTKTVEETITAPETTKIEVQ